LEEHAEPELFHLDPLPPRRPTENEDDLEVLDDQATPIPEQDPEALTPRVNSQSSILTTAKHITSTGDNATSPSPNIPASQQTDITTLSISESAFDSPDRTTSNEPSNQDGIESSRRARVAAYLAARQDTFSAWSEVSLVSADNHAEEEIEL
jgi:hypothetical protein